MKRWITLAVAGLVAAGCQDASDVASPDVRTPVLPAAGVDPALVAALAQATGEEPLEVIVNYDEAATNRDALTDAVLALGAGVIQFEHLSMVAALATPSQIAGIEALPGVEAVHLNRRLEWMLAEGPASINADDVVRELGITGAGVGIAILDSGIDGTHPDLDWPTKTVANVKAVANLRDLFTFRGSINGTIKKGAQLFIEDMENSETSVGHGTHVAGIAAGTGAASGGKYTGVAPGADLIGIGTGDILFIFWALAGFDYILDHREELDIQVVNNSWGSSGGGLDPDDPIQEATREVFDAGVAVVFSAGNCGQGDPNGVECPTPDQSQLNRYALPSWVISVAAGCKTVPDSSQSALHCNDGRDAILADFSSRGLEGDPLFHPDVIAPGVHVVSARASTGTVLNVLDANHDFDLTSTCAIDTEDVVSYTCASGTSMSSPHVAGVIALMEEAAGGTLTPAEAYDILTATARPLDGYGVHEVGMGYVDALAAVRAARD